MSAATVDHTPLAWDRPRPRPEAAAPLRAVDRTWTDPDGTLVATKNVTADDPYLEGHYPGAPIFPGVFTIETAVQAVTRHLMAVDPRRQVRLTQIASVRFRAPFFPGDELTARIRVSCEAGTARAVCKTGGPDGAVRASMTLVFEMSGGDRP